MRSLFLLIAVPVVFLFMPLACLSQDIIPLHDSTRIEAKLISITPQEVRYKEFSYQDGPTIVLQRSEVYKVRYPNGQERIIHLSKNTPVAANPDAEYVAPTVTGTPKLTPRDPDYYQNRTPEERAIMFEAGEQEAHDFYTGSATKLGVGIATFVGGGVGGILVGSIAFITPPDIDLHPVSNPALRRDPDFRNGYQQEAHRKKRGKVASGFGLGMGTLVALIAVFALSN